METDEWFSETGSLIESSAGFSVRILGRTGLRYFEDHRSVWIDSEVLAKPGGAIALFKDSIKTWEGDADVQVVSEADRDRIVSNIKRAFEFFGYELVVSRHVDWRWLAYCPKSSKRFGRTVGCR